MGGFFGYDGGDSTSNTTNHTYNNDNRVDSSNGGFGVSGGSASVFNITDGNVVARGLDSLDKNFKLVNDSGAAGLSALLGLQRDMFSKSTQQATDMAGTVEKNVLEAYRNAASDATGTIDNKTIIALAVAAVVGFGFIYMRKKS